MTHHGVFKTQAGQGTSKRWARRHPYVEPPVRTLKQIARGSRPFGKAYMYGSR